jgi:hypothetical protein
MFAVAGTRPSDTVRMIEVIKLIPKMHDFYVQT